MQRKKNMMLNSSKSARADSGRSEGHSYRYFGLRSAVSRADTQVPQRPLRSEKLPLHRGWELINVARNWLRRNSDPCQHLPLPRLFLPRVSGHKLGVRNVVARIFMARRIVGT